MKFFLYILAAQVFLFSCTTKMASHRLPASEVTMAGDWCAGAKVEEIQKGLIEIKLPDLDLILDKPGRAHKYCNLVLPFDIAPDQSLKIKSFTAGAAVTTIGAIDMWQEKRLVQNPLGAFVGGELTRRNAAIKNSEYKENNIGAVELGCGADTLLRIDLAHTILSRQTKGSSLNVSNATYKLVYEISPCSKE